MPDTIAPRTQLDAEDTNRLKVTLFDQVASLIVASLIVIGFVVLILAILVFTRRVLTSRYIVGAQLVEEVAGRGDHPAGFQEDLRAPSMDALQDLSIETNQMLEAVTSDATAQVANPDLLEGPTSSQTRGRGDRRRPGPLALGRDIIPRWERWEITFRSDNLDTYAAQLDSLGIELAAIGGDSQMIEYASQLSRDPPQRRTGPGETEDRLYMTWRSGELKAADEKLLRRAGIRTGGRITVQFFPPALENQLALLEQERARDRPLENIFRTIFGVRSQGPKFEFFVVDQILR